MESITAMAKKEVNIPLEPCCSKAFLSALLHSSGSIVFSEGGLKAEIESKNARLLRAASKLFYELFAMRTEINGQRLTISSAFAIDVLEKLGILRNDDGLRIERGIARELTESDCCKRSYLKGIFLSSGTVIALSSGGYHLEFLLTDGEFAEQITDMLHEFGLPAKSRLKKDKYSVYLKAVDDVCDFLALMGASVAVLHLNNIVAERQMRKIANRNENCDLANIEKTVKASTELIGKLRGIVDKIDNLALRRTAELRISHPEATYAELARLAGISKSGLTHRLHKLEELAEIL